MDKKAYHDLKDMLCRELEKIAMKGELTAGSLETVHKLTDTIKNIDKIGMLEEEDGYSERRDSRGRYSREGGMYSGEGGGSYARAGGGGYSRGDGYDERGSSYARRGEHYVRAHYSREGGMGGGGRETRGGYSRDDGKDQMLHELGEMMEDADTEQRRILERAMQEIRRA